MPLPGLWLNAALTSPAFGVPSATLEPMQRQHGLVSRTAGGAEGDKQEVGEEMKDA